MHSYEKLKERERERKKWQFKEEALPPYTVEGSSGSSCPISNSTEGDEWVPENDNSRLQCLARQRCLLLLQNLLIASNVVVTCVVLLATCSNHCLQTPWYQLQSVQAPQSTLTDMVLSLGWGLGSSASSRVLCFRISARWSSVRSCSWYFCNSNTSSATYVRISALGLIYCGLEAYDIGAEHRKSAIDCIFYYIYYIVISPFVIIITRVSATESPFFIVCLICFPF